MLNVDTFKSVRYVIDPDGHKSAVQLDMGTWSALLAYLEDLEDRAILKDKLSKLFEGPQKSGAMAWSEVEGEW